MAKSQTCIVCEMRPALRPPLEALCGECVSAADRMERAIAEDANSSEPQLLRVEQMPGNYHL